MKESYKEPAASRKKTKKSKRKRRLKGILILELLFILIVVAGAFIFYQFTRINTYHMDDSNIAMNDFDNDDIDGYRNIAIFGVDSRANKLTENTRSDSIIIASINKKTKDVKLLSIFRDTYVNIEGHGYTKINHAYSYGGPELAISTINQNFDLDVKDFVTVNFSALTNVIDKLGGITIDITDAELEYVNKYTKDVAKINGTKAVYLTKAGKQKLNGTQATAYCRVRYTKGGDFTRAQRQRTVMQAILKEAKSASIPTIAALANEMIPQIYTSLDTMEIVKLASSVFSYEVTGDTGFPFDNTPKKINKAAVVVPNTLESNVSKMHEYLFGTDNYTPSNTVISYSNEIKNR